MDVTVKSDVPSGLQLLVGESLALKIEREANGWLVVTWQHDRGARLTKICGHTKLVMAALHAALDTVEFPKETT